MTKEQAITYLRFSGFSDEQIKAIEGAFTCDKCVYSTSEGCQYDDITEAIPPFDDLISRQAAIDAIRESTSKYTGFMEMEMYTDDDAVEAINGVPSAQPEQRWIPCSERTPEKAYGQYWVCTDTGYQCQCRWTDDVYGLGSSGEWAWKIFDIPQYSYVAAWMPLPKPYKAESEVSDANSN